ncbi:ribosome maturation factor RimP [Rhabdothermincola salaria]|uniref:ribosome maturation factor RimP n=1 Tax=Rhabdothermincola salaria TaxID=2903142 RepID=UPI001E2BE8BA|nr:ribosome maturation factor RimP [Rhabdothermincola salaria]MCD9624920.1 ribosome maturation factor RimP [Rhabdothermincola salaria]
MSVSERVRAVVEPVVAAEDVELFDLEQAGPVLRVTVDRPGGLDMQAIASVTRALSRALDEHDPINGQYTLEVSSPGLERTLRTPGHYAWAVGRQVSVKTVPGFARGRRFAGTLASADATGVVVALDEPAGEQIRLDYPDIEKARTVFDWGPAPKPGGPKGPKNTKAAPQATSGKGKKAAKAAKAKSRGSSSPTSTSSTTQETVPE